MEKHTHIALFGMLSAFGIRRKDDRLKFARACGVDVDSFRSLTDSQGQFLCEVLEALGPPV